VRRPAFAQRDHQRQSLRRQGLIGLVCRRVDIGPLLRRHLAGLFEPVSENRFGGLIVEDQRPVGADDEDRQGETARQLTRQYELDLALRHGADPYLNSHRNGIEHKRVKYRACARRRPTASSAATGKGPRAAAVLPQRRRDGRTVQ
jgi:hypothetical protein